MMHGQPVQHFPVKLPLRHELIRQSHEAAIVSGFEEMNHLMNNDVFEAFARFLCKFGVEPNALEVGVAASPFRFHLLHKEPFHFHADYRSPLFDQ